MTSGKLLTAILAGLLVPAAASAETLEQMGYKRIESRTATAQDLDQSGYRRIEGKGSVTSRSSVSMRGLVSEQSERKPEYGTKPDAMGRVHPHPVIPEPAAPPAEPVQPQPEPVTPGTNPAPPSPDPAPVNVLPGDSSDRDVPQIGADGLARAVASSSPVRSTVALPADMSLDTLVNFQVERGSFRANVNRLHAERGLKVVWASVPDCVDWSIRAGYEITAANTAELVSRLLDGYPLKAVLHKPDRVLAIHAGPDLKWSCGGTR